MTRVLIIGAGAAGLGAAQVLAMAGADVTVVERQAEAGGFPRLSGHSPFGMREFHLVLGDRVYARKLTMPPSLSGQKSYSTIRLLPSTPGQWFTSPPMTASSL